jgi:ABC-type amino acid transport system permease subunit
VVAVLAVGELLTVAQTALGSNITYTTYWVSLYMLVGLLYLVVALIASLLANRWEKRHTSQELVFSLANA